MIDDYHSRIIHEFNAGESDYAHKVKDIVQSKIGCEAKPFLNPTLHNGPENQFSYPGALFQIYTFQENMSEHTRVAMFSLAMLQGCCGVCVSFHARVTQLYRHSGLGTLLQQMRIDLAREMGYGLMLVTDKHVPGSPQSKILVKNGFTDICQFYNPRSTNKVNISVIKLV